MTFWKKLSQLFVDDNDICPKIAVSDCESQVAAKNAVLESQQNLEQARSQTSEVKEVAASLRALRERNHFAEQIVYLVRGEY